MKRKPADPARRILEAGRELQHSLQSIDFSKAAEWVYDPFDYAWDAYAEYVTRHVVGPVQVLFMGMNPGPWGMAQTGVPFGEVAAVRDWLQISKGAKKPAQEHPKRPIEGLACRRSEVSGRRLWGLFAERFQTPQRFFAEHMVVNYCPLAFMDSGGKNLTPDKFPASVRTPLEACCDHHLVRLLEILEPRTFVGVGGFAEACGQRCIAAAGLQDTTRVLRILHPSPASPAANRDWAGQVTKTLEDAKVW